MYAGGSGQGAACSYIPTVTKLVEELLSENIIADRGKIETSGGRRPTFSV